MLSFRFNFAPLVLLSALLSSVAADARNWNPNGDGCVDSKGFLSCYQNAVDDGVGCVGICNTTTTSTTYDDCVLGCYGHQLATNVGCWIESCWNEVYSCEYQLTALSYFDGLDLVQSGVIPFYPPPDDASAGSCSCNLGYVYGNQTDINMNFACTNVAGSGDFDALYTCECCEFGYSVSNILNVCPHSDLSILGFPAYLANQQSLLSQSTDNCTILDNSPGTCVSTYGYPFYGKVTNALNLPPDEPGTEPLSNAPGNAFTDFGSPTYTLSLFPAYSSVLSPAPFNDNAGINTAGGDEATLTDGGAVITATGAQGTSTGTVGVKTGTKTESGTRTGTSGSAGATKTGGAAGNPGTKWWLWVAAVLNAMAMAHR